MQQHCSSLALTAILHEKFGNHVMVWASCSLLFYQHAESCILIILDVGQRESGMETLACDKVNTFILTACQYMNMDTLRRSALNSSVKSIMELHHC